MSKLSRALTMALALLCLRDAPAAPPRASDAVPQASTAESRLEFMRRLRNDRVDPALLSRSRARLAQLRAMRNGVSAADVARRHPLPPPDWRGMPTTGVNNALVLLIEFEDELHAAVNTRDRIHSSIFGDGVAGDRPYESLARFYQRSSFGKLTIQGDTLGWYRAPFKRSDVIQTDEGREALIRDALRSYDAGGYDFSRFDNDGDGDIDYLMVIYAGPDTGWGSFWWAYQTSYVDASTTFDGKTLSAYVFQFQSYAPIGAFDPGVVIHETGHALGLPDLYDYDAELYAMNRDRGPRGGVGGLDMMDGNLGDHNAFSKWILGWIDPRVVDAGSVVVELRPSGTSGDAVIVMPGATELDLFAEYFVVENRSRSGNDDSPGWPGEGLAIWHVDARLNPSQRDYLYDNSSAEHKLIRVMEADGREDIERIWRGDADDFFKAGGRFDSTTRPSSNRYDGSATGVFVRDISVAGTAIRATVGIDSPRPARARAPAAN